MVVRADMRGSGDSDGVYYDEYLKQEQDDCCDLLGMHGSLNHDIVLITKMITRMDW